MQIPFEPIFSRTEPRVPEVELKAQADEALHQRRDNVPDLNSLYQ